MAEIVKAGSRPKGAWRWILGLSLALNILIVASFVGAAFSGRMSGPRGFDFGLGPLAGALAPDDARAMRDQLRRNPQLRPQDRETREAMRAAFVAALLADPFDPTKISDIMLAQSRRGEALQSVAREAFVARLTQMSPRDRAALAERIATSRGRGPIGGRD